MGLARNRRIVFDLLWACAHSWFLCGAALVVGEALITSLVVWKVPYTEIDYATYLEQAALATAGERDYARIRGAQGPLVYPAGHVWLYALVGRLPRPKVQALFGAFYVLDALVMARIYSHLPKARRRVKKMLQNDRA